MIITFTYSEAKDIDCLLTYGKNSQNSNTPTQTYTALRSIGEPTIASAKRFIYNYLSASNIDLGKRIIAYQTEWDNVSSVFEKIAEEVFKISLPISVCSYLTINTRLPYNIEGNYFYVTYSKYSVLLPTMHELWHFYTWYKFGQNSTKTRKKEYNIAKEVLTVIINQECESLLPKGVIDRGYAQHQPLRKEVITIWNNTKDIEKVWGYLTNKLSQGR